MSKLFVWGLSSYSRIFHSYGGITGDWLQILTYPRHLRPLSRKGSLACHTNCDTRHPFIMVISEDPWHSHLLPSVWQWSCNYHYLGLSRLEFEHPTFRLRGQRFNPLRQRGGLMSKLFQKYKWNVLDGRLVIKGRGVSLNPYSNFPGMVSHWLEKFNVY